MQRLMIGAIAVVLFALGVACGSSPTGAQSNGTNGRDGVSGYEVRTAFANLLPGGTSSVVVSCPAGKSALSGGFDTENATVLVVDSFRGSAPADWVFHVRNNSGAQSAVTLSVVCVIAL